MSDEIATWASYAMLVVSALAWLVGAWACERVLGETEKVIRGEVGMKHEIQSRTLGDQEAHKMEDAS